MKDRRNPLPDPAQRVYGRDMYELGYQAGYKAALWDLKKNKILKERNLFKGFSCFIDHIDDLISAKHK